jgi:hypothetical protein
MSDKKPARPSGVKRIVYREIVDGDRRKFQARSTDTSSGGGARDLRFGSYEKFADIFRTMFPSNRVVKRRRGSKQVDVKVLVGQLHWVEKRKNPPQEVISSQEVIFEPPTDARRNEGRLTRVHTYPPLRVKLPTTQGRLVLLLVQRDDDSVWPEIVTEKSLRSGGWDDCVAGPILRSLDSTRSNRAARGYMDFENGDTYSDV